MKPYGRRPKTREKLQGHGGCGTCLEKKPPAKRRARAESKRVVEEQKPAPEKFHQIGLKATAHAGEIINLRGELPFDFIVVKVFSYDRADDSYSFREATVVKQFRIDGMSQWAYPTYTRNFNTGIHEPNFMCGKRIDLQVEFLHDAEFSCTFIVRKLPPTSRLRRQR